MEIISFLLLFIIMIMVISLRNKFSDKFDYLQNELHDLHDKLDKLIQRSERPAVKEVIQPVATPIVPEAPKVVAPTVQKAPPEPEPTPKPIVEKTEDKWQSGFKRIDEPATPAATEPLYQAPAATLPVAESLETKQSTPEAPVFRPSFSERHPDLEKFIGENLVSKIGIVILVIAIGFFVKYAIDQNWIGEAGRVGIGILCGGVLIGLAHWLRNSYRAFSSVLTGGGLAVFYFTITLAFQQFQLFGQTTAFIIMVVITAFSVGLSLLYDKQEVAILALIGGFATPFMASNGSGNYKALFTYLLLLNAGLLVLSYFKKWRLLNLLAFLFTIVLFGSWLYTLNNPVEAHTYINALWFATAFYLLFFAINVAHNISRNKQFIASDFGIILANTALYFAVALYCLTQAGMDEYRGLLCILLSVFNLVVSFIFFKNKKVDTNILYLLIGITLTFISLAAPIQLKGNHITLFWACETVLLYWLFQKSNIELMRLSALIVWVCMLLSLFMDWNNLYFTYTNDISSVKMTPLLNKGFITSLFAAVSTGLLHMFRKKEADSRSAIIGDALPTAFMFGLLSVVLLYVSGALEINYQFVTREKVGLYQTLYTYAFVLVFLLLDSKLAATAKLPVVKPLLLGICILIYLVNASYVFNTQQQVLLNGDIAAGHFMAHWIAVILVGVILFQTVQLLRNKKYSNSDMFPLAVWAVCAVIVFYLSVEMHLLANAFWAKDPVSWDTIHIQFIKIGLPILWSVCSFALMWLGMHYKQRILRIISLALFAITLIKLFVFDIKDISEGGKIAAFFCLGVILLIVSFMYQRLKKIIISEEKNAA